MSGWFAEGWEARNKRAIEEAKRDLLGEIDSLRMELARVKFELARKDVPRVAVKKTECNLS